MLDINKTHQMDCFDGMKLLDDKTVDLVLTDPPYNVKFKEQIAIEGRKALYKDFNEMDWDKLNIKELYDRLFLELDRIVKTDGSVVIFCRTEWITYLIDSARENNFDVKATITWHKCLYGRQNMIAKLNGVITYLTVRDMYNVLKRGSGIELYSSEYRWVKIKDMNKMRPSSAIHIYLHNGGILKVSKNHKFRINNNFIPAYMLKKGDVLDHQYFDVLSNDDDLILNYDLGWLIGLFVAEGNYDRKERGYKSLRFSIHDNEVERFLSKLRNVVDRYKGKVRIHSISNSNGSLIMIDDLVISAFVQKYVKGDGALRKHLNLRALLSTNKKFVEGIFQGYLDGDGSERHTKTNSWRLSFGYNPNLMNSLAVISNILGYDFRIKSSYVRYQNGRRKCYVGMVNLDGNYQGGNKPTKIRRILNCSKKIFYEIILDEDHTYIMPEGVISHNSNPIPQIRKRNYLSSTEAIVWVARWDEKKCLFKFNFLAQNEMHNFIEMPICQGNERTEHPTQKPLQLMERFVRIHSNKKDLILDPFIGSGTTAVAAKRLGRDYIGFELNPKYVNIANKRASSIGLCKERVFGKRIISFNKEGNYGLQKPSHHMEKLLATFDMKTEKKKEKASLKGWL